MSLEQILNQALNQTDGGKKIPFNEHNSHPAPLTKEEREMWFAMHVRYLDAELSAMAALASYRPNINKQGT